MPNESGVDTQIRKGYILQVTADLGVLITMSFQGGKALETVSAF